MSGKAAAGKSPGMAVKIAKGALLGAIVSVLCILLYALILKQGWLNESGMAAINVGIKAISAAIAALVATWRCPNKRWLFGGIAGGVYILLSFAVFSILSGQVLFSAALLSDIGMGVLIGMFAAMIRGIAGNTR